ncbi:MAG: dockerin type I repeat-containing protein [Clostridia bacterium]|nr:dockerin type I repeat-containing protein [Clostridia bacterium]
MTKNRFAKKALSIMLSLVFLFSVFTVAEVLPVGYAEQGNGEGYDTINWDKVNAAIEAIHDIGAAEFTAECMARINTARAAYDALNGREKREVSNLGDLTDAEAAFHQLSQGHNTAVRFIADGAVDGILDTHENRVYFGSYAPTDDSSAEPILWRMLDNSGGKMLLLSDKNLEIKPYHISDAVHVSWSTCSLRTWLNGSSEGIAGETDNSFFNNAFSSVEQSVVRDTDVNGIIPSGDTGQTTEDGNLDKVFILSSAEVMNPAFGFPDSTAATGTRVAEGTAALQFHWTISWSTAKTWWLRDTDVDTSRWVHDDGQVIASSDTGSYRQNDPRGVRPALYTDLSQVLFASPASGGKNANGALAEIPEYTGKEWKLTVRNNNYRFKVDETAATAVRGGTVTLHYTKAKYGTKDRISAMLVNADGHPLYYGQIAQATSAAGSVDITIPQGVAPGAYTLRVFNEQLNGDCATDAASAFSDVALTVTVAPGDVDRDGEVDLGDVVLITRWLAGGWNVTLNRAVADVNDDGIVDLKDVVLIRRYLAGGWGVTLV